MDVIKKILVVLMFLFLDMSAKTMLFDQRIRTSDTTHYTISVHHHIFISFNPQGRQIAPTKLGNLAGKIEIEDRRTLRNVCMIDAPNTSYWEWSPDGRFFFTATLSPRLQVKNGIKIWHCSDPLLHLHTAYGGTTA